MPRHPLGHLFPPLLTTLVLMLSFHRRFGVHSFSAHAGDAPQPGCVISPFHLPPPLQPPSLISAHSSYTLFPDRADDALSALDRVRL